MPVRRSARPHLRRAEADLDPRHGRGRGHGHGRALQFPLPPPPANGYRRYWPYGYPGIPRRYRRRAPVAAGWRYVLLALGVLTLGFASLTATAVHLAPAARGIATVDLKVCATTKSVDPSLAADGLELGTAGGAYLVADTNLLQASSSFRQVLPPGHCTTGSVPFSVPAHTDVTHVQLPGIDVGATWTRR